MRIESQRIAVRTTSRASHPRRIQLRNRRKPLSNVVPAAPDRRVRRQRLRPHVPDPARGHGTQHQRHGRFSPPRAKVSVRVMFQTSAVNRPGKRLALTAFPEEPHGHRIVAAPPHPVRQRRRHRTVVAVPDARISIDSVPGIWSRITALDHSAPAARQWGFPLVIRNARR
jgi:hypothetical protein